MVIRCIEAIVLVLFSTIIVLFYCLTFRIEAAAVCVIIHNRFEYLGTFRLCLLCARVLYFQLYFGVLRGVG